MFSEYDSVRVVSLGDGDRWSEGSPSVGDIGTIVDIQGSGADTRYIVEHAPPDAGRWWLAEFTENELVLSADRPDHLGVADPVPGHGAESKGATLGESPHRSEQSRDRSENSAAMAPAEVSSDADESSAILVCCTLGGALTSILFVYFLGVSAALTPLVVAGIAGAIGGFSIEPIADSLVVALFLGFISAIVIYSMDSSTAREVILAVAAGLALGKLVGSILNELLKLRHRGRS